MEEVGLSCHTLSDFTVVLTSDELMVILDAEEGPVHVELVQPTSTVIRGFHENQDDSRMKKSLLFSI